MTKIYIAGHRGMVGSAIVRNLQAKLDNTMQLIFRTHKELDLTNQQQVNDLVSSEKPDQIYLAAAKVGGIHANNTYPADFIYQNLMIQANIIHAAHQNNIPKLLFLGSSCIYPKDVKQPMQEEALLTNTLEPTNEPYAIAKIAGIKLCESYNRQYNLDYRSVMPTNLYGPGDNYHLENSHVIPALIRKFHEAKVNSAQKVTIWGSGNQKREFLYVDDMAAACVHVMNLDKEIYQQQTKPMLSHINVGACQDLTIKKLAEVIARITSFKGKIEFDITKPDGTKRKLIDSTRLNKLGWQSKIDLEQGIKLTYQDYCRISK
jgi:GDP-L-fucose synthase